LSKQGKTKYSTKHDDHVDHIYIIYLIKIDKIDTIDTANSASDLNVDLEADSDVLLRATLYDKR